MDFFTSLEVSASGLSAQRVRMNVASSNLANVSTTRSADGGPYRRKDVVLSTANVNDNLAGTRAGGNFAARVKAVDVTEIRDDAGPPKLKFDPGHPDANAQGYVEYPNISPVEEMVDMITASRAYEAGVSAMNSAMDMAERALGIGR